MYTTVTHTGREGMYTTVTHTQGGIAGGTYPPWRHSWRYIPTREARSDCYTPREARSDCYTPREARMRGIHHLGYPPERITWDIHHPRE